MRDRRGLLPVVLAFALLGIVPAVRGDVVPSPRPEEPEPDRAPAGPLYGAEDIANNIDDVWQMAHGVYVATVTRVTIDANRTELCFEPFHAEQGPVHGVIPERLCAAPWEIEGVDRIDESTPSAWVFTRMEGKTEHVFAAYGTDCTRSPCFRRPAEGFAHDVRCGQLERAWSEIPAADLRCSQDMDCGLLTGAGNCFHQAINVNAIGGYRALLERQGLPCHWAVRGACAPQQVTAVCDNRVCTARSERLTTP